MRRLGVFSNLPGDATVAWRAGAPLSRDALLADVAALVARLPAGRHVLNLAVDRYAFLVGYLAAVATGRVCLLPPSKLPSTLAELCRRYPDAVAIAEAGQQYGALNCVPIEIGTRGAPLALPDIRDNTVVAVLFTSGSTGAPTAHTKTWGSFLRGARALERDLARRGIAQVSVLGTVPPQHMYGIEATIMLPLSAGWPIHAACPLLPADLRDAHALAPGRTFLVTMPLHLRAITLEQLALGGIAGILSSTMPLARTLAENAEALLGAPLVEIYGSTETGAIATRRTAREEAWRPLEDIRLRVDEAAWCEGGHVEHPVKLADRIRIHADGSFALEGRIGDIVKVAGKRASLTALNNTLIAVPGVLDGVFFRPRGDEGVPGRLGAIVVAPEVDEQAIVARLAEHLDSAFLPRPLYRVDALPREASGKLPLERLHELIARLQSSAARPQS
jgi:acyl-coenzyme A synthetase/AMP-(fatty) acid ligase